MHCPYAINKRYLHTESGLPLTVKYIGPLPPSPADDVERGPTWIGVEWDDPARGKHSGTYQGVQVFHCRIPGAASFLKYKSAKQVATAGSTRDQSAGKDSTGLLDPGQGFFQAVYERYIDSELDNRTTGEDGSSLQSNSAEPTHKVEKIILGSSNGQIVVEMPNIDRVVQRLRRGVVDSRSGVEKASLSVREIGLEGQWVHGVERRDEGQTSTRGVMLQRWLGLKGKLNNVYTLNLSRNLIPSWHDLAAICAELPNLRVLVINYSRFQSLNQSLADTLPAELRSAFTKIEQLHVCNCAVSWKDVLCFTSAFPSLRTLDVAGNALLRDVTVTEAGTDGHTLTGLDSLDLTACAIDTWEDLLGILLESPNLRELNISSNPLQRIPAPSSSSSRLPPLDTIVMNDTRAVDWQSIDNLQIMFGKTLKTFKYSLSEECRLAGETGGLDRKEKTFTGRLDDRVYLIAKLPALETLNGTTITKQERTDAERFYLAQAAKEGAGVPDPSPGWGRLKELKEVHGESQGSSANQFGTTTLKSKMVDIAVECPDLGVEQFKLSLLPTAPIKLLKTKIARQLGVPITSDFGLSVLQAGMAESYAVSVDGRANVASLDLEEGDIVLVDIR